MLELFQIEGCSECGLVREKLSELFLDFTVRQVPAKREQRSRLNRMTGQAEVPVLIDAERRMIVTEAHDIIAYLQEFYGDRAGQGDSI